MKWCIVAAMFFCVVQASPVEYLTKIDLVTPGRIYDLSDMQITVVDELEGSCLAVVSEDEFALLKLQNFPYKILDADPQEKSYYIVYPAAWVPLDNLRPYGDILHYDGNAVIFRTEEKNVIFLNQMQVELKKVFLRPMVLRREAKSLIPPASPLADSLIQQMVNQVSADSLLSFLTIVVKNFGNRYTTAAGCTMAIRWAYNKFRAYGMDSVYLHQYRTGYAKNCVAMKRGIRYPNWKRYFVICGHLDAISGGPGADDNATGAICAVEAARVMRRYRFENGIRFIDFTGEEQGLVGSEAYAANAQSQGDTVFHALDFDMIMYQFCNPETMRLAIGRTRADTTWHDIFKAAVDTYTTQRTVRRSLSMGSSDNASFWAHGYPAFCAIENRYTSNPHYHTSHDSIGASGYSIPFFTNCVKAAIAGLARFAVPMGLEVSEESNSKLRSGFRVTVFPNPARHAVKIVLAAARAGNVTLGIYDATGRKVKSFDASRLFLNPAGSVWWDRIDDSGTRIPAGVYIIRVSGGGESASAKVVIAR